MRLRGLDTTAFPTIRATVLTSKASRHAPALRENGVPVVGYSAENLGREKNVVLAIDRSRSMAGQKIVVAARAAAAFVARKPQADRIALVAFGSRAVQMSRFSSATIDADNALRTLEIDGKKGTALYDAVVASARSFSGQSTGGRVIILLTDGRDVSSTATEQQAVDAARKAGAVVYPIAVGSDPAAGPLKELARRTGGAFYGAASSGALRGIYASIAAELRRTWQVEYVTAARPGDRLHVQAAVRGLGSSVAEGTVPAALGAGAVAKTKPTTLLPSPAYGPVGDLIVTLFVALLVLGAATLFLSARRPNWLKNRLAPHVEPARAGRARKGRKGRERLELFSGLFGVTERAFGHRSQWRKLQLVLERADVPLRTVEFAWLMVGCAFVLAVLAALSGRPSFVILGAFAVGAMVPYLVVSMKAKKRMRTFEDQLPDLLITMAASLKAGHSFKQGIQSVVDEGQEPAAKELKRVLTDTRLGRPMDEALQETAERIGSKNFSFVITAVTIQRQVGGSLAGLFDMVADTVRQRQQFARKIRSLTAMGRASAYVLIGLPFFIAIAITLLNGAYMDPLYHSHAGHMLIALGLVMMTFGTLVLRKIVSFRG